MRVDVIRLTLRKNNVTVVRDAVELVPPTAFTLYLERFEKAISKIDDFLSNFSSKKIQNRKNHQKILKFWWKSELTRTNVAGRVVHGARK